MISKKKGARAARRACGIALAVAAISAHAETGATAPVDPQRSQGTEAAAEASIVPAASIAPAAPTAAAVPAAPIEQAAPATAAAPAATDAASASAAAQTRVRFARGNYKPGIEQLRVVRRENTMNNIAGQVALNIALSVIAGGVSVSAQGFSKNDLGGTTLEALKDDPLGANPAIDELSNALSKVATDIYRRRAEAAYATALTDGSTAEEIEEARKVQAVADTPLLPGSWHLVYENLTGSDELFRLKFGAALGRAGFMRPPAECFYQSEPVAWNEWQADNWQRLREERAKAVARCTETLSATPEKFW
ncbi:hypothetical protein [uncultured Variovorax sp.]|uniref:hypothetical protein n=1 Tax=uncultured Variovorax sp. TaxID=114708 RepID=UPI0025FBB954|nr:hypothetical protein [uncultured Variovorax sp.]